MRYKGNVNKTTKVARYNYLYVNYYRGRSLGVVDFGVGDVVYAGRIYLSSPCSGDHPLSYSHYPWRKSYEINNVTLNTFMADTPRTDEQAHSADEEATRESQEAKKKEEEAKRKKEEAAQANEHAAAEHEKQADEDRA